MRPDEPPPIESNLSAGPTPTGRDSDEPRRLRVALINQPWDKVDPANPQSAMAIWTTHVASQLAQRCQVTVYSRSLAWLPTQQVHQNVLYRRLSLRVDRRWNHLLDPLAGLRPASHPLFASAWYYRSYSRQVAAQLARDRCDIAHVMNFTQALGPIRAADPNIKLVLHLHCDWLNPVSHPMLERRLRLAQLIIGCSEHITEQVRRRFPSVRDRCVSLYDGVDIRVMSPRETNVAGPNGGQHVLYVGRISPEKGLHNLIDAFRLVAQRVPTARLDIVGTQSPLGPEVAASITEAPGVRRYSRYFEGGYIQHLIERAGPAAGRITFWGPVPYAQLQGHYRRAALFVYVPVWSEPMGVPVIEAMASSLPIVATRCGGIPELVEDQVNGLLVEPNDARGLAQAITTLLEDPARRNVMGREALQRARDYFSWEQIAGELLRHYYHLCQWPGMPSGSLARDSA